MVHLSDIAGECPTCGGRELFTGHAFERDGHLWAVLRCPTCRSEGLSRSKRFEEALAAYVSARRKLRDPQRYDLAWALLRDRSPAYVELALRALTDGGIREAPFFRLEDVAFPDTGEAARAWAELALEYPGFRPAPEPAQRVEEALAVALQLDSPSCAESAAGRLHTLDPDGLETVLDRLPHRASGAVTAEALIPFFEAVVAAGGASRKLLREREMPSTPGEKPWRTVPGLSEAARRARGSSE